MFVRLAFPLDSTDAFTDIRSTLKKIETEILLGRKTLLPIFIFHHHVKMIAAEAHYIPYPGCVEKLLPRAIHKTVNNCENTPDEGFPQLSNIVTTDLGNDEKVHKTSHTDFREV